MVKDPPSKTHLPFQMLISREDLSKKIVGLDYDRWGTNLSMFGTYVNIPENRKGVISDKVDEIYHKHHELPENVKENLFLQSIKDIHLDTRFGAFDGAYTTSKPFIWIFTSVGLVILIIALINFINLSIVQSIKRSKEVGLRKVIGATCQKLLYQFLSETFIIVVIAEILALIIVEVILPPLNNQMGSLFELTLYGDFSTILFLVSILFVVSIIAGLFPALFLSKYTPVEAIKNKINAKRKIIGVTENFHTQSLRKGLEPVVFNYHTNFFSSSSIKPSTSDYSEALTYIEKTFKDVYPGYLFEYELYEDYLQNKYKKEEQTFNILKIFSLIAIILASMGLFGLVSFMMIQKTKEIGIRKAIGANSIGIVCMYVFRYLKIVLVASLFALPVAFWLLNKWLMEYAYRVTLHWGVFVLGTIILLSVALLSILFQTIRTARKRPAYSLQDE